MSYVKRSVKNYASTTNDGKKYSGGLPVWHYTFAGVVLAEYYLVTKEKWVLDELEEIRDWLLKYQYIDKKTQVWDSFDDPEILRTRFIGGWGHERGFQGYGPMAMTTGQASVVLSLMERCGLKFDRKKHELALLFLQESTSTTGYVWYNAGYKKQANDEWADKQFKQGERSGSCLGSAESTSK